MGGIIEKLKKRGFFQQCTDEEALDKQLTDGKIAFYCGIDPTFKSLHIGHLVPIMAMAHLQKMGHKAIALVGGGTAMIGDPSGKTESRKMLTIDQIDSNVRAIKKQLELFINLDGEKGILVNNADWLRNINYLEFLRDVGRHFSVNRMLSFETYKMRMETGLSFLEFNYLLLQSYDFLELYNRFDCKLQIGGDDQWANMLSGVELIRRTRSSTDVECLTFPLVLTSDGKKMGKTEKGALFLDPEITTPYDFYQYWVNVTDADVIRFLKLYTFLEDEEIAPYEKLEGAELNEAKRRLAYEATKLVHGKDEADKAKAGAEAAFGGGDDLDKMPTTEIEKSRLDQGINIIDLFVEVNLGSSKGEVKRLIKQGGCRINGDKITDGSLTVDSSFITDKGIILASGKKKRHRIVPV